jgi:hypothetical protein
MVLTSRLRRTQRPSHHRYSSNSQRSPTRYFLLCSHPTLLPPLDSTHIKSRTAKDSELVPVLTACIIVRLVYAGACEDLGRMGTLSKWWRV